MKDDAILYLHPEMIQKAQKELSINLSFSVLFSDDISSKNTGIAADVVSKLVFAAKSPAYFGTVINEIVASISKAKFYLQRVEQ